MSHINVTINGRQYRMACEEGQEVRLLKLAESLETRIQSLRGKFGEIGDARLTVMAALTVCDELVDAGNRIRTMEQELTELRDFRNAAVERARVEPDRSRQRTERRRRAHREIDPGPEPDRRQRDRDRLTPHRAGDSSASLLHCPSEAATRVRSHNPRGLIDPLGNCPWPGPWARTYGAHLLS
ncbi:cell division protein ZapA (FtsZ GTPase activity inhibitor) [Bradyrhizobium sp. LM3.4]